jgi:hypothetical protein
MVRLALASVVAVAAAAIVVRAAPVRPDVARVYVTVLDEKNKPLTKLTAADFSVKEDGAAKTIVTVEPATSPLAVALVSDHFGGDSTYSLLDLRAALESVVKRVHKNPGGASMAFYTIDPASVRAVDFTESEAAMTAAVNKVNPGVEQAVLLEGIVDASRALASASTDRRVIFAVVAGYKLDLSTVPSADVAREMHAAGVSLWVLEGRSPAGSTVSNANRDQILNAGVHLSGGVRASVAVGTALETQGTRLVDLILAQYAVTYAAPSATAKALDVAVGVPGAKVIAPGWAR